MSNLNGQEEEISGESKACEQALPGQKLVCSLAVEWTSLLVQKFKAPCDVEPFETAASPEHLVVLMTKGCYEVECFSNGFWRRATYWPGLGGMTVGGYNSRLRWQSKAPDAPETLHLYIPQKFFEGAKEEYRRAGSPLKMTPPDTLLLCNPVVSQVVFSLEKAIEGGAPNLYAQSAGQFLATHLLSVQTGWPDLFQDRRHPAPLTDRRLRHVLEYINAHYKEPLSLDQLAREAGISRFHFMHLFKEKTGVAPHQYLVNIRMEAATRMLGNGESSILEVAFECGYQSAAHFSAAFQKHFSQAPASYRRAIQNSVAG